MKNQGGLLKLISESEGVTYFKIISVEETACRICQICQVKKGVVQFKYRSQIEANIYKSEIGYPYVVVSNEETDQLRKLIQSKMLDDFQLLTSVYYKKLGMIT